jgi:hypothetical protein
VEFLIVQEGGEVSLRESGLLADEHGFQHSVVKPHGQTHALLGLLGVQSRGCRGDNGGHVTAHVTRSGLGEQLQASATVRQTMLSNNITN